MKKYAIAAIVLGFVAILVFATIYHYGGHLAPQPASDRCIPDSPAPECRLLPTPGQ